MRKRPRTGFTLIELLVAVAILATLVAIFTPKFMRARFRAYHSGCLENMHTLRTALETYHIENQSYPDNLTQLVSNPQKNYVQGLPRCPSAPEIPYDYTVRQPQNYTILCKGGHAVQLGDVPPDFPRAVDGTILVQ